MSFLTRRAALAVVAVSAGLVAGACVPEGGGGTPGTTTTTAPATTTTTTTPVNPVKTVSNATFEWTISREADNGSFAPGQVNYWSAGQSDSTAATYTATNGNATVLKKNAAGTFVPIGSETAVSWANRNRDGANNVVTATNAFYLGQKVRYTGGTGTVNTTTGAATIQWTGTFTINFYGQYVPFWVVDPKLTIDAAGTGRLTATLGGFASDMSNPDVRTPLAPVNDVLLAEIPNAYSTGAIATGFAAGQPNYVGKAITTPPAGTAQVASTPANAAFWGSWPQAFVDFQQDTGLGSYWYTSGGSADSKKPQEPIAVAYTLNP